MNDSFMAYPTTVKGLATELIKVCDAYKARQISNTDIQEIILWYATKYSDLLFDCEDYNTTVKQKLGKKRISLLDKLLDGYQHRIAL